MVNNSGRQWESEVITNRVTVSKNSQNLRVSIKAPAFGLGNNFLTLCLTIGVIVEVAITYLMIKSSANLAILVPGFIVFGAGLGVAFFKLWLWHNFGEERINIRGNSFELHRNYGLYKGNIRHLILNNDSELFTNRNDTWSWLKFRGIGVFRLNTIDAKLADFGLKLNEAEYAMIIKPVAEQLENIRQQASGIQFSQTETNTDPVPTEVSSEVEEAEEEEVIQLPNLEKQTEGQHTDVLNGYLEKASTGQVKKAKEGSKTKKTT